MSNLPRYIVKATSSKWEILELCMDGCCYSEFATAKSKMDAQRIADALSTKETRTT